MILLDGKLVEFVFFLLRKNRFIAATSICQYAVLNHFILGANVAQYPHTQDMLIFRYRYASV